MGVWDINQRISEIFAEEASLVNEDGEVTDLDRLLELDMEQTELKEQLALDYKNLKAESAAIKAEEIALADRRKRNEHTMERIAYCLSVLCDGEKLKTPRCEITFRKSKAVVFDDEATWVAWAKVHRPELLTFSEPKPSKTAISGLLKAGEEIAGANLRESVSMSIK